MFPLSLSLSLTEFQNEFQNFIFGKSFRECYIQLFREILHFSHVQNIYKIFLLYYTSRIFTFNFSAKITKNLLSAAVVSLEIVRNTSEK